MTSSPPTSSALRALLSGLDGATLRELASLADRARRPRFCDPELAAAELATMIERGERPALGWWRRHIGSDREEKIT